MRLKPNALNVVITTTRDHGPVNRTRSVSVLTEPLLYWRLRRHGLISRTTWLTLMPQTIAWVGESDSVWY